MKKLDYWFYLEMIGQEVIWPWILMVYVIFKVGTQNEVIRVFRENLSLRLKVSGFIPRTYIWNVCFIMHDIYWSYDHFILHGKTLFLHSTILLAYWYSCMGWGCRPKSVAVIPKGNDGTTLGLSCRGSGFCLGFRARLVG